ncbi:MAG: hypothetical protein LBC68_03865 [Prevotellaceae bacterium]|jgi:hypothetical protein|nr:hypothetical protein [Prevotellaceae bacterium]
MAEISQNIQTVPIISDPTEGILIPAADGDEWKAIQGNTFAKQTDIPNAILQTDDITGVYLAASETAAQTYSNSNPTVLVFYFETLD